MACRKIFNFESNILKERTFEIFGYYPEELKRSSNKGIVAICRFCGEDVMTNMGQFNNSGSACHKDCHKKELAFFSPFKDPEIRKKGEKTKDEKYGKDRKLIREKISKAKTAPGYQDGVKQRLQEKYGVDNVMHINEVKDKLKQTNLEKYGCENPMQNLEVQAKGKATNLERYGSETTFLSTEIKAKSDATNLEKYGTTTPLANKDVRAKKEATMIEKYGCKSPIQNPEIREKIRQTNLERYGVDFQLKRKEIKDKSYEAFQKMVEDNVDGKYNVINTLRNYEELWSYLAEHSILQTSEHFNLPHNIFRSALIKDEFKDRYKAIYIKRISGVQKVLFDNLRELCPNEVIEFDTWDIISPLQLDIYFPARKLAIEFNGSYYHSEKRLGVEQGKYKHFKKLNVCREKGIRLLNIFEHDWLEKRMQIMSFIKNILQVNEVIDVENCVITERDGSRFIENYNIHGYDELGTKFFNLEYDGNILVSLSAEIDNKSVIIRNVCQSDLFVKNGLQKLFSFCFDWAKRNDYSNIIVISDNCLSDGDEFLSLNFEMIEELEPEYFYWFPAIGYLPKTIEMENEFKTIKEDEFSEYKKRKIYKIWDCGRKVFVYNL